MSSTIFFFFFVPLLSLILLTINLVFAPHSPYTEKNSAFECGFSSFVGQNRTQFTISFFMFGIFFLLFDLEILLVYPYLVSAKENELLGLMVLLVFLAVLIIGFAFELGKKALSLESRQTSIESETSFVNTNTVTNNISNLYITKSSLLFTIPFLLIGLMPKPAKN